MARDTGGEGDALENIAPDQPADPRTERTRSAVLEAGVEILFERGPEAVTHASTASAARVSRTTVYKHWPTRGELVFDVLNCVEPHRTVEPTGNIRADMMQMARNLAQGFADPGLNKVFVSLLSQAQWDDETSEVQDALIASAMVDMTAVLDAAVESGQLVQGVDPLRAAGRLIGPMFFAALIARRPIVGDEVDRLVDDWLAIYQA